MSATPHSEGELKQRRLDLVHLARSLHIGDNPNNLDTWVAARLALPLLREAIHQLHTPPTQRRRDGLWMANLRSIIENARSIAKDPNAYYKSAEHFLEVGQTKCAKALTEIEAKGDLDHSKAWIGTTNLQILFEEMCTGEVDGAEAAFNLLVGYEPPRGRERRNAKASKEHKCFVM